MAALNNPDHSLTEQDIEVCQKAFADLDEDNVGAIKVADFKIALERIGYFPLENELYKLISELDDENTGFIKFNDFLNIYLKQKIANLDEDDQDTIDAFVAIGGQEDKGGSISSQKLVEIIKEEFQMTIDIEKLIEEIDEDGSGEIEFGEFKALLKQNYANEML